MGFGQDRLAAEQPCQCAQVPGAASPRRSFLDDQLDGDTALRSLLDASLEAFNTRTRCDFEERQ